MQIKQFRFESLPKQEEESWTMHQATVNIVMLEIYVTAVILWK